MSGPAILAVDPGKMTGWAWYTGDPYRPIFGQTLGRHDFYGQVESMLFHELDVESIEIVVESYTITPASAKMSAQYDPLMIIGALEKLARDNAWKFTLQPPSHAKRFMTNEALKKLGWWMSGAKYEHAMDAARHLGLYMVESKHPDADAILSRLLREE